MELTPNQQTLVGTWALHATVSEAGRVEVWLTHKSPPYSAQMGTVLQRHTVSELPETDQSVVSWFDLMDYCLWAVWSKPTR
jgi:hypothetical protein